jgi:hypothetical protein
MRPATKYFNTSGPNIRAEHYTLERPELIEVGRKLVHDKRYFTIWAPRQTGKSTYYRLLAEVLQTEGYKVCHVNVEHLMKESKADFLQYITLKMTQQWGYDFRNLTLAGIFNKIDELTHEKMVLIIDEIEGINAEYFSQVLHSIRQSYHFRNTHALKSVILVGVANITGIVQDNASPFNVSDNLQISYFSKEETFELLEQHETATGQLFHPTVKQKIYDITAGQPGLVNGFAEKLLEKFGKKPEFDYKDYLEVENWYLYEALDKNVANVMNKAKAHQKFLEELLFIERKVKFDIDRESIRYFHINGLIRRDEDGNVTFWVPLYKKRLQKYFYPALNGESDQIQGHIWIDNYLTPAKKLNIDKIIREYQAYAKRRGFRYFIENDEKGKPKGLREAALMYSFETYIQSFLEVFKGKSYLEPHIALGRSDLIINTLGTELVIEAKIYRDITKFEEGKTQLAYYTKSIGLNTGIYLVFVDSKINNPYVLENDETIEGVQITTYLVKYDLETDFSAPKRKRKSD